jgi:hypothetical protein
MPRFLDWWPLDPYSFAAAVIASIVFAARVGRLALRWRRR